NGTAIVQRALKRPHHFETLESAFAFYRGKRVFSEFSDEALKAYVVAAHSDDGEGVKLLYSGAWEACVYRSVPSVAGALRSVDKPCLVIAGEQSYVLTSRTARWIRRCNQSIDIQSAAGGHLLPLEAPDRCADMIASFVKANSQEPHNR
ncbi:MAG: alpha/beta hydrolase, partial [Pseudomonadota bacterium]|nr:alpha/beta hydrolase [Pseudomonadota bacterium]